MDDLAEKDLVLVEQGGGQAAVTIDPESEMISRAGAKHLEALITGLPMDLCTTGRPSPGSEWRDRFLMFELLPQIKESLLLIMAIMAAGNSLNARFPPKRHPCAAPRQCLLGDTIGGRILEFTYRPPRQPLYSYEIIYTDNWRHEMLHINNRCECEN
jgi:hypothetical protein